MSIGENIKKLRLEKNLTQKKLSELTGISEVMISQYERGIRTPKNRNLVKLACVLDRRGERLLGEELPFDFIDPDYTLEQAKTYSKPIRAIWESTLDVYEHKLLNNYRELNECGKKEANKRVEELTEINKYTEPEK